MIVRLTCFQFNSKKTVLKRLLIHFQLIFNYYLFSIVTLPWVFSQCRVKNLAAWNFGLRQLFILFRDVDEGKLDNFFQDLLEARVMALNTPNYSKTNLNTLFELILPASTIYDLIHIIIISKSVPWSFSVLFRGCQHAKHFNFNLRGSIISVAQIGRRK